jgi:S-adenosylmethionine hydrolase
MLGLPAPRTLAAFRMIKKILALFALALALCAAPAALAQPASAPKTIGFMTDFGLDDDSVAICKAVMDQVAPGAHVIDITHTVQPYNIAQAARFLAGAAPYFPKDAVFVVVVDPGVGSARKAIIVKSGTGQMFVLPDNGLLTLIQDRDGLVAAREITNVAWMIGAKRSSTFHGRDIFSPTAAHLARGDDWTSAGPEVEVAKLVRLDLKSASLTDKGIEAQVIGTDGPYGNLILNLPGELFAQLGYAVGEPVPVTLDGKPYIFPLEKTFSDVPVGKPLFYIDSRGRLSLGVNEGDFSKVYAVGEGARLSIPRKAAP